MQASWWFCLTSSLLLGLEEVIDLTISKSGTQGSLKLRTVFLIGTGWRLPRHSLCKKLHKQGRLKWGQHQLSGPGLHTVNIFKSIAAVRGARSQLLSQEGIFEEWHLLASWIKADNKMTSQDPANLHTWSLVSAEPWVAYFTASGPHIPCCIGLPLRQHSCCPKHLRHHAAAGMGELDLLGSSAIIC